MAKDPAFLFYTADFMIGVAFMTYVQRGKYISLLCYQHQLGHLTERQMLDVCGEPEKIIFEKFIQDADGLYYNERLENESKKRKLFCESRKKSRLFGKRRTSNVRSTYVPRTENENIDGVAPINTTNLGKIVNANFEDVWAKYPKRVGKKDALRHFNASVKTQQDYESINKALDNYLASETVSKGFIQNGSTWFNNWPDYVDMQGIIGKSQAFIDLERMIDANKQS